jgi:hypothetical protein
VSNQCHCNCVDPRIESKLSLRKFWKLVIVAARQVFSDLPKLFFNNMKIIDQPIGGG